MSNELPQRNWTTADPTLHDNRYAHETRATLRMHRAGWPAEEIRRQFRLGASAMIRQLKLGMDEEHDAHLAHHPIHDVRVD